MFRSERDEFGELCGRIAFRLLISIGVILLIAYLMGLRITP